MNAAQRVRANRRDRIRLRETVSAQLKRLIEQNGTTHEDLADSLGCSVSQSYRLVAGDRTPEAIMVRRIARVCGVTVESLLNGGRQ